MRELCLLCIKERQPWAALTLALTRPVVHLHLVEHRAG